MFHKLRHLLPGRDIYEDVVVIDSALPTKNSIGPRNSDLLEFAKKLPGFKYYTMYPMMPGKEAWFDHGYGMTRRQFDDNLKDYLRRYPEAEGKVKYLSDKDRYHINLAYTYFLAETYTLLPFLERHNIPFVFLLNPGGAFAMDNESSDAMLRVVFASPCFRKVILNQEPNYDYLIRKKLCAKQDAIYDFSGSAQFKLGDLKPKKFYPKDKSTFDICFVAAKYTPLGVDKGYDLFIGAAKQLARRYPDMRFHVVGGFDEHEIDVSDIRDVITFYGYMLPHKLPEFYSGMDIYLSPNRPGKLYQGNADGFPLSAGAMYCGVCGFNADETHLNTEFDDDEVVIVRTQVEDIVKKVEYFHEHLDELYRVSRNGQKKAQFFYDIDRHIDERIKLFEHIKQNRSV